MDRHKLAALLAEHAKQNTAQGGIPAVQRAPMQPNMGVAKPMPSVMQGAKGIQQPISNLGAPQIQPKLAQVISPVQKALLPPVSSNANFARVKSMMQGPKAVKPQEQTVIKPSVPKKPKPI